MAKGRMSGMGNMGSMMKQVQKMQQEMARLQGNWRKNGGKQCRRRRGNGCGYRQKELKSISIKPEAVDPDDVEMLEDLILAAVNEALRKAEQMVAEEMSKITGGLNIPGL